jgi:hypothetical protein
MYTRQTAQRATIVPPPSWTLTVADVLWFVRRQPRHGPYAGSSLAVCDAHLTNAVRLVVTLGPNRDDAKDMLALGRSLLHEAIGRGMTGVASAAVHLLQVDPLCARDGHTASALARVCVGSTRRCPEPDWLATLGVMLDALETAGHDLGLVLTAPDFTCGAASRCRLARGAPPYRTSILCATARLGRRSPGMVGFMVDRAALRGDAAPSFGRWTPLHHAAASDNLQAACALLARGWSPDAGALGPLHVAALSGSLRTAVALLAAGADAGRLCRLNRPRRHSQSGDAGRFLPARDARPSRHTLSRGDDALWTPTQLALANGHGHVAVAIDVHRACPDFVTSLARVRGPRPKSTQPFSARPATTARPSGLAQKALPPPLPPLTSPRHQNGP